MPDYLLRPPPSLPRWDSCADAPRGCQSSPRAAELRARPPVLPAAFGLALPRGPRAGLGAPVLGPAPPGLGAPGLGAPGLAERVDRRRGSAGAAFSSRG